MAKYCIKCGKALPEGVDVCPDCHVAAGETDAAPFTRITAQTEVWKDADKAGAKTKKRKVRKTRSQVQKRTMLAFALLAAAFLVFAVLFTRPAPRVVRAIRGGDYDKALAVYWGSETLAAEGSDAVDRAVLQEAQKIFMQFAEHTLDADTAATALSKLGTIGPNAEALLADTFAEFRAMTTSQAHMEQAEKLFRNGEFLEARAEFLRVTEEDAAYDQAQTRAGDCLEQYALAYLVYVESVALMAYGAYGEDDFEERIDGVKQREHHLPLVCDVVGGEAFALEEAVGLFVAIGYEHSVLFQPVDDGSAECDDEHVGMLQEIGSGTGCVVEAADDAFGC